VVDFKALETIFKMHQLSPNSGDLTNDLALTQMVKKFPVSYGTRSLITGFIEAHHG
jgi:hypothetical protein